MAGLGPAIQISPLALDSRLKGGYDRRMQTPHSVALHLDAVLLQRVADLPRREPEDPRGLRLNPPRLFHGFDERVFAKLRKITIDFTRWHNLDAVSVRRFLGFSPLVLRSCRNGGS